MLDVRVSRGPLSSDARLTFCPRSPPHESHTYGLRSERQTRCVKHCALLRICSSSGRAHVRAGPLVWCDSLSPRARQVQRNRIHRPSQLDRLRGHWWRPHRRILVCAPLPHALSLVRAGLCLTRSWRDQVPCVLCGDWGHLCSGSGCACATDLARAPRESFDWWQT